MPKPIKQPTRPRDVNQWAHQMVEESTQVIKDTAPPPPPTEVVNISASPTAAQISVFMAEMGRRGGKIGGKRRAENMTPKERSQLALKAAKARWNKRPG